jgi:hypothetical protein
MDFLVGDGVIGFGIEDRRSIDDNWFFYGDRLEVCICLACFRTA